MIETFRADKLEEFLGYKINFCQDNESKSSRGVLHYQLAPFAQTKLVRVIQGRYKKKFSYFWQQKIKSNFQFQDNTIFAYKVDNYYSPECDDGSLNIDWINVLVTGSTWK